MKVMAKISVHGLDNHPDMHGVLNRLDEIKTPIIKAVYINYICRCLIEGRGKIRYSHDPIDYYQWLADGNDASYKEYRELMKLDVR